MQSGIGAEVIACRICGCTEAEACVMELGLADEDVVGCTWDGADPRLCTFCAENQRAQLVCQIRIAEYFLPAGAGRR